MAIRRVRKKSIMSVSATAFQLFDLSSLICVDDMRQTRYRFIMLILAITFLLGQYFCYDNPSVIEKQMEETLGIDNEQWSMFFKA